MGRTHYAVPTVLCDMPSIATVSNQDGNFVEERGLQVPSLRV